MYSIISFAALGLLGFAGAISTVTVSVNTGECPATYSSVSTASASSSSAYSGFSPSVSSSISSVLASSTATATSQTASTQSGSSASQGIISLSSVSSTGTSSSASTTAISTTSTTSTTASSAAASGSAAPCPCPGSNNKTMDDSLGYDYEIMCDESFSLLQGPGSSYAATFDACMVACDSYVDESTYNACTAAVYLPGDPENGLNCFLTTDSDPTTTAESGACIAMVPPGEQ